MDADGKTLQNNGGQFRRRHKRSLQQFGETWPGSGSPDFSDRDDGTRFYTLEAFGRLFHLVLHPDSTFIAPSLVVQYLDINETRVTEGSDAVDMECFYSGQVIDDPDSVVHLSVCHSLVSLHNFTASWQLQ